MNAERRKMSLFRKTTKAEMLATIAAARKRMEKAPASKGVMQMHDILTRFEAAYKDGREPDDAEVKGYLGEMIPVLEDLQ
jgi:hypothetical protein